MCVWPERYWPLRSGSCFVMPRPSRFVIGQKLGRLTGLVQTRPGWALYQCECKLAVERQTRHVLQGNTRSCGCLHKERALGSPPKHGMYGTPTYAVWNGMISRCTNPKHKAFKDYGGRGISVCERWRTFKNFFLDMGCAPAGMTLDRQNNNLGYSKANCRWVSHEVQSNNTRANVLMALNGKTQNVTQWAKELGWSRNAIYDRLRLGWTHERTLTQPIRKRL